MFCRDRGGGEARARRGRLPAPSRSPHRVCCGHRPRVACPCGQTAPAHPAWPQLPRLTPPWECQPGQGSFSPPCSLFSSSATQKEKKREKKGRNCSEMIQSFLQKCLLSSCREGTPPHPGRKDFQRILRPCLAAALSRVPHPTGALPRGDVPLLCGRRPPGGPSPSTPMLFVRGLASRMGPLGVWVSCGVGGGASGWEEACGPLALTG